MDSAVQGGTRPGLFIQAILEVHLLEFADVEQWRCGPGQEDLAPGRVFHLRLVRIISGVWFREVDDAEEVIGVGRGKEVTIGRQSDLDRLQFIAEQTADSRVQDPAIRTGHDVAAGTVLIGIANCVALKGHRDDARRADRGPPCAEPRSRRPMP